MALFKNEEYLTPSKDEVFDQSHTPGSTPPRSGIYRCTGCGREVVAEQNKELPPQNNHQHSIAQGNIRWKLIVFADHREKP